MNTFLMKKWDHVFDVFFDINKSKTLEWADFELLVEKIKNTSGENSRQHTASKTAMKEIWEGLVKYDVNKDNKVSREEWRQMWQAIIDGRDKAAKWQKVYLDFMFIQLDSSGDKLIDKGEYAGIMAMYGFPAVESQQSFDKFTKTPIDYAKFVQLWAEYFKSTDQRAPGNHLFGKLK